MKADGDVSSLLEDSVGHVPVGDVGGRFQSASIAEEVNLCRVEYLIKGKKMAFVSYT